eukprot:jgi/Psemu1/8617/gm1.8617_g
MLTYSKYIQITASPFGSSPAEQNDAYNTIFGPLAQHSPNTDKAFGYLDDIEGEAGELVLVDADMLSQTTASQVLSLEHHMAELDAHQQRPSIPVVLAGTGHSELIRAHKAFFIPFEVAGTAPTVPAGDPMLLQPGPPFQIKLGLTKYMKKK